jgi:hypothetical protein
MMKYIMLPFVWFCWFMDWLSVELDRAEKYWERRKRQKLWEDSPPF